MLQVRCLPKFGKKALVGFGIKDGQDILKMGHKYDCEACVIGTQFLRISDGVGSRAAIKTKVEQMLLGITPRPAGRKTVADSTIADVPVMPTPTVYQLKVLETHHPSTHLVVSRD